MEVRPDPLLRISANMVFSNLERNYTLLKADILVDRVLKYLGLFR
jgi:hypothetical protein